MHLGLICPEAVGHLNPLTTLGRELAQRGEQVTVIGGELSREFAEKRGLNYEPLGRDNGLAAEISHGWRELGRLGGLASMRHTGKVLATSARMILDDLPAALARHQFDGLVIDQLSPAALIVAEKCGVPQVIACNALAMIYDPYLPPPTFPWRYRPDALGYWRSWIAKQLLLPLYENFSGAGKSGVRPLKLVFETSHGLAIISQQPEFFDFPNPSLPPHFHYTGPWHDVARDHDVGFPWDWLDGRALVYASMGTLQNNRRGIYMVICDAVRDLPIQVVLSRGGGADDLAIDAPQNVLVVPKAPQLQLLDRAVAAITHAGLNTALECVQRGVPMVCLPVTNDQPGVAMRIESLGLGEVLPAGRATGKRLRILLKRVLDDSRYRSRGQVLRGRLPESPGVEMAADIVVRAFRFGDKVI